MMKKIHKKYTRFSGHFEDHVDGGCAGEIRRASPNREQPGLHVEPLNVAIGRLFAPYCPGTDGGDTTNTM